MGDAPQVGGDGDTDPTPIASLGTDAGSDGGGCSDPVPVELSMGGDYYHACCGDANIDIPEGPKLPFVGDKEPLSALASEFQSGSPILQEKIKIFIELLENVLQGHETSIGPEELLERTRDDNVSDCAVMFFRFVTSCEIQRRAEFFEPFISGLTNFTLAQASVEPMGEESDHLHIIALSDALGVPIRVMYLDRSSCDGGNPSVNHHDFIPAANSSEGDAATSSTTAAKRPYITLLYRPGHYDILYPK